MRKTRKIQVTLEEEQYEKLTQIAGRDGKKLAGVVRESIVKYCLAPEKQQSKQKALQELLSVEPVPAPDTYRDWKRQYGALKTKAKKPKR